MIYIGSIKLNRKKYYLVDTKGTLSENIFDSVVFLDKETAERYLLNLEYSYEELSKEIIAAGEVEAVDPSIVLGPRLRVPFDQVKSI